MTPGLLTLVMAARGHNRAPGDPCKRRIVVRFSKPDLARLDALRAQLPGTSRAQILRAFTFYMLAAFGTSPPAPPTPEGGAP